MQGGSTMLYKDFPSEIQKEIHDLLVMNKFADAVQIYDNYHALKQRANLKA